jgi:RNA polymerase sigma factor (sigma-70 family)
MLTARSDDCLIGNDPVGIGCSSVSENHHDHYVSLADTAAERSSDHPRGFREQLYIEFTPLVKRLLRQYGTDPELRHDLPGEIYCLFCSYLESFDPGRGVPLRPYLVRQLTASVYTYVRRRRTTSRRELCVNWSSAGSVTEPSDDPTPSWIAGLSKQEIVAALPYAIAHLPSRQRAVLIWRYYDNLPFEEIADILQVKITTCRSLLRHALNNLRKEMTAPDCP